MRKLFAGGGLDERGVDAVGNMRHAVDETLGLDEAEDGSARGCPAESHVQLAMHGRKRQSADLARRGRGSVPGSCLSSLHSKHVVEGIAGGGRTFPAYQA